MTKIIPYDAISHLAWAPGETVPTPTTFPPPPPLGSSSGTQTVSIDDIIAGNVYFSDKKVDGKWVGLPIALREALESIGIGIGYIPTMPEFMAAKAKAEKTHDFWQKWYTVNSEEDMGIDTKGRFYAANQPVLVVVHGGGILTPDRIEQAYGEGLVTNSAKYTDEEFDTLLDGILPSGEKITLYTIESLQAFGAMNMPRRFGVVMPYAIAQGTTSGQHTKADFMANPLVIARTAGYHDQLDAYFDKAKSSEKVGCYHPFAGRDPAVPQGRVLYVDVTNDGLYGSSYLGYFGRFVGVGAGGAGGSR